MCAIIGVFNHKDAFAQVKTALALLKSRGKDGFGIASEKNIYHSKSLTSIKPLKEKNILGHALHSIVNYVPQPLKDKIINKGINKRINKGTLVANCEIYNWQELAKKYQLKADNDADLLLKLLDKYVLKKLEELDGTYALAYWKNNQLILARDILGVKPLFYVHTNTNFAFASEKKALLKLGYKYVQELNPRQILTYSLKENKTKIKQRGFFTYSPEHQEDYPHIKFKTLQLLSSAIEKRIPKTKFGVLFSGGIDSTFIAYYLKQKSYDFTCYTAALDSETTPIDLIYAEKIAKEFGLKLKVRKIQVEEISSYLKKIVPLIEDSNVVKVSVALTLYLACELAKEDGCKVIFSGLGSEEIFAGYERHKRSLNLNQECLSGLRKLYERDLYRDDVISMDNNLELRLPFLDKKLIEYALKIPDKYKIQNDVSKYLLRDISLDLKIPYEYSFRKKVAAQYGSRFDQAIEKLARINKFASRSAYTHQFYPHPNLKLGVLFSSGKDSTYSALIMRRQNYELTCLITIKSENPASYMFHTPAVDLAKLQSKAMDIPLIMQKTKGEKELELKDLEKALQKAKEKYHIEGIITGAVFSTYQRDRVEVICDKLGLKIFSPLWHKPQEQLMSELLHNGFEFIFTAIAAEGLDKSWLNRKISEQDLQRLIKIKEKLGINIAGEGGEFESLVLDCPLFKQKILLEETEILEESKNTARLIIKKTKLVAK